MKKKNKTSDDYGFFEKDDDLNLSDLIEKTNNEIIDNKISSASDICNIGEILLSEISNKNKRFESTKQKQIKWILKKSDIYFYDELNSLTYHDVKIIYLKMKEDNKNKIKKIIDFFINPQ